MSQIGSRAIRGAASRRVWRLFSFSATVVLAAAIISGCSPHTAPPSPPVPAPAVEAPPEPTSRTSVGKVTVYREAKTKAEQAQADENGLVPETITIPIDSRSPAKDAIEHLIAIDGSPIPAGTRLLGIKIDSAGVATVDFSKEFVSNFKGGDKLEAEIINSVRATLGQFADVKDVQFLVGGAKIAQLGGTLELTDPLPVIHAQDETASNKGV